MKKFYNLIPILLILFVEFIPNLKAIDLIGPQWLYLSLVNLILLLYNIFYGRLNYFEILKKYKLINSLVIVVIFNLLSIINSINIPESIITINNYCLILFSLLNFILFIKNLDFQDDSFIIVILIMISLESFLSITPILKDLASDKFTYGSKAYYGLGANINITAYSILIKVPLVIYGMLSTRKNLIRKLSILILFVQSIIIFSLGTRSAVLLLFLFLFYIILHICTTNYKRKHLLYAFISIITAPIFLGIYVKDYSNKVIIDNQRLYVSSDNSVKLRLGYYEDALSTMAKYPFIGIGSGNWKLYSIFLDKDRIQSYKVPYHTHNDYLEIGSESGVISMIAYILFTFIPIILFIKKNFRDRIKSPKIIFLYIAPCLVFISDSLINFPVARPINIIFFTFLISYIIIYDERKQINNS